MKNFKKFAGVLAIVGMIATAGIAYAATSKTPAEIAAGLTGKTVEALNQERAAGKTYGAIAAEAGKLDDFQALMLEQKKAILDQRVKDGSLTQAEADAIYNNMKNNMANCDGSGLSGKGNGQGCSLGIGGGCGMGAGQGNGQGNGRRSGRMMGSGRSLNI